MSTGEKVKQILSWYPSDNPGTLTNLARMLDHGTLGGTGKMVILPVDQGFEHGPHRSFAPNPAAYDPEYHFQLAIEAGCNAYAAPLGFLEAAAAKDAGLPTVVWSYPRGGGVSKDGETAVDVVAYAAQLAAQLGAHVIKVKPPKEHVEQAEAKKVYEKYNVPIKTLADRVRHVVQSAFNGHRIVIFSGGEAKDASAIMEEIKGIRDGGGFGSIIGRNSFQRPKAEAIKLLHDVMNIYKS